jgi:hypothetical protein
MELQYISDNEGRHTAVIIPIAEWNNITEKHKDLKELTEGKITQINNAARFKGLLNEKEAVQYDEHLKKVRNEWDRNI